MSKMTNQQIERHYFEMFREHYRLPEGTILYGDRPDIIVKGARKIGIEMTRFFKENGGQRESQKALVAEAQRMYEAKSTRKVRFIFDFGGRYPIRDPRKVTKQLADLAGSVQDRAAGKVPEALFKEIPEVSFVWLTANQFADKPWSTQVRYDGQAMSLNDLQHIVSLKEAKAKDYKRCDAYWLLVVVDYADLAQNQEIRIDGLETIRSQFFERVIIYKTVFHHIIDLPMVFS